MNSNYVFNNLIKKTRRLTPDANVSIQMCVQKKNVDAAMCCVCVSLTFLRLSLYSPMPYGDCTYINAYIYIATMYMQMIFLLASHKRV